MSWLIGKNVFCVTNHYYFMDSTEIVATQNKDGTFVVRSVFKEKN